MDQATREIIMAAIANGSLRISLSVDARHGEYGSGDGVAASAYFVVDNEVTYEGQAEDYISVEKL